MTPKGFLLHQKPIYTTGPVDWLQLVTIGLFYARKSLGAMIKIQQTLQVLSVSHNRMGALREM
jgi:hypothetical protein